MDHVALKTEAMTLNIRLCYHKRNYILNIINIQFLRPWWTF